MLIWLPPSEGKLPPIEGPRLNLDSLSFPGLHASRRELAEKLRNVSAGPDAAKALGLGKKSAAELVFNQNLFTSPCAPAEDIYQGVLFSHLDSGGLTESAARSFRSSTWIFSALFGAVRPKDLIPMHRLAMGARIPGMGGLSSWWRPRLEEHLPPVGGQTVLDLRSGPYASALPAGNANRVEIRAVRIQGEKRQTVSHLAKLWRGVAAKHVLESGMVEADPTVPELLSQLESLAGNDGIRTVETGPEKKTKAGGSVTVVTLVLNPA